MPYYQKTDHFKQCTKDDAFNAPHAPADEVRRAGIYRCDCGFEVARDASDINSAFLPDERNCRNHSAAWKGRDGIPTWLLVAVPIDQVV